MTFLPSPYFLRLAAKAIDQHRNGGMSEAQRINWTELLQQQDRNGCHLDEDSLREVGYIRTVETIVETLMGWASGRLVMVMGITSPSRANTV